MLTNSKLWCYPVVPDGILILPATTLAHFWEIAIPPPTGENSENLLAVFFSLLLFDSAVRHPVAPALSALPPCSLAFGPPSDTCCSATGMVECLSWELVCLLGGMGDNNVYNV